MENQLITLDDFEEYFVEEQRDYILGFNYNVSESLTERLGLPKDKHGALLSIIAELLVAHEQGKAVSYSRRKVFYCGLKRYCGGGYTYARVLKWVSWLEEAGYIYNRIAPPRPPHEGERGTQSTMRATPKLLEACRGLLLTAVRRECLCLNGPDRKKLDYNETEETIAMRREVEEINSHLRDVQFDVRLDGVGKTERHICIPHRSSRTNEPMQLYIPHLEPSIRRVFCRASFDCGGRLFGPWQNIPKRQRQFMTINGELTVEPDYPSLHARLAYALSGCPLRINDDPYDVGGGFDREQGKYALLISFNARNERSAVYSIAAKLSLTYADAANLYQQVVVHNWPINQFLSKDKGVVLQKIDSDIAIKVMQACQRDGIPVLPVHDSFIVPQRAESLTREHMDRAWSWAVDHSPY
ncbi:hypothetical protein [Methylobacterium sp. E-046]|uniref:hypothetical protein n=1 Tax=Methylobacterium sp. E-046 TaxID=2836576 RepID=UPI001FB96288|nr:hypothetical protein [Methylobacterium sp. E-046]MCJ2101933.1 hypothetical protein [Methylobacterium sp. E-046]